VTKDAQFGFTAATGEPLICAIIFSDKTLKKEWVTGFDLMVNLTLLDQHTLSGEKQFLASTAALRVVASTAISVLPCSRTLMKREYLTICMTGLAHCSQFELDILECVNCEETKWSIIIGIPYGTSF